MLATSPSSFYDVWFAYVCCGCICRYRRRRAASVHPSNAPLARAPLASSSSSKPKPKKNPRTKPTYSSRVSHGERTDDGRDVRPTAAAAGIKQASERDADMTDASRRQRRFTVMFAAFAAPRRTVKGGGKKARKLSSRSDLVGG